MKKIIQKKCKNMMALIIISGFTLFSPIYSAQNKSSYQDLFLRIFAPKRYESLEQRPTAPLTRHVLSETKKKLVSEMKDPIAAALIGLPIGFLGLRDPLVQVILSLPAAAFTALIITTGIIDMLHYEDNRQYIAHNELQKKKTEEEKKERKIVAAQSGLSLLIGQKNLFPTRSSQINALVGKEFEGELVKYIGQKDIMIEARNRVLQTVVKQTASEDDKAIDEYASKLREEMAEKKIGVFSLKDQINYLETKKDEQMKPLEATGYNSLLKRLQNRLAIEKRFAPIESASEA